MDNLISKIRQNITHNLSGKDAHLEVAPYRNTKLSEIQNPRLGSVLILLYQNQNQVFFPLIQRPQYDGVHGGQIALPGGKLEIEDTDLSHTALRETEEEIGVPSQEIRLLGKLSNIYIEPSNFLVHPYVGYMNTIPLFKPQLSEVDDIYTININELMRDKLIKNTKIKLSNNLSLNTPYLDIQDKIIWGATAAILNEFRYLISE